MCCLCNGSRSWWNGLKYCFLQYIRLHRITAWSFFHPQRLGGNFISFYQKKGWLVVLPLQLYSVPMEWIEILFLAMHPSSSYYCMPIFSPTTIGWKLHFILSFWWLFFSLHSSIFPLCQTLLLQPMVATSYLFTSVLIVAYFSYGHYFYLSIFLCICCLHGLKQPLLFPRHMIVLIGYLSIMLVIFFDVYCRVQLMEQPGIICTFISYSHSHLWRQQSTSFIDALGFGE